MSKNNFVPAFEEVSILQDVDDLAEFATGPLGWVWTLPQLEFVEIYGLLVDAQTGNVAQDPSQGVQVEGIYFDIVGGSLSLLLVSGHTVVLLATDVVGYSPAVTAAARYDLPSLAAL